MEIHGQELHRMREMKGKQSALSGVLHILVRSKIQPNIKGSIVLVP